MHLPFRQFFDQNNLLCFPHFKGLDELGRMIDFNFPWLDGGDSANRTMAFILGVKILYNENLKLKTEYMKFLNNDHVYRKIIKALECENSPGNYKRHPDKEFWYSDCDRFSRDQLIPLMSTFVYFDDKKNLKKMFKAHLKRSLLFTTNIRENGATKKNHGKAYKVRYNSKTGKPELIRRNYNKKIPDITGPRIWALYLRGFDIWILYPIIALFDFELLINAIIRRNNKDIDCINHCIMSIVSHKIYPTPITWLVNKYINDIDDLKEKLKTFYYQENMPYFLADIWSEIIDNTSSKNAASRWTIKNIFNLNFSAFCR